jgi:hypothetical protein
MPETKKCQGSGQLNSTFVDSQNIERCIYCTRRATHTSTGRTRYHVTTDRARNRA